MVLHRIQSQNQTKFYSIFRTRQMWFVRMYTFIHRYGLNEIIVSAQNTDIITFVHKTIYLLNKCELNEIRMNDIGMIYLFQSWSSFGLLEDLSIWVFIESIIYRNNQFDEICLENWKFKEWTWRNLTSSIIYITEINHQIFNYFDWLKTIYKKEIRFQTFLTEIVF